MELENIYVDENNKYFKSVDGVLYNADCTALVKYPMGKQGEEYTIPNGVVEISACGSFSGNVHLKKIIIPSGVTRIGKLSFDNCQKLEEVIIPKTVKEIGKSAFYYSTNLKNIYYEGSVAEWENIKIEANNECLTNATIHFNSNK